MDEITRRMLEWAQANPSLAPWALALLVAGAILLWKTLERLAPACAERLLGSLGRAARTAARRWIYGGKYRNWIARQHGTLAVPGPRPLALARPSVPIYDVYVPVAVAPLGARGAAILGGAGSPGYPGPRLGVGQVLHRSRRVVLLGEPGSGKTTLLRWLAWTYAGDMGGALLDLDEPLLPVFFAARDLPDTLVPLPRLAESDCEAAGISAPPGFFESALRRGRCAVLIDAVDEVAEPRRRRRILAWLGAVSDAYPRNRYVVTARPAGLQESRLRGFDVFRILPLEEGQVADFVNKWYRAIAAVSSGPTEGPQEAWEGAASRLLVELRGSESWQTLARTPLTLALVALVQVCTGTVPPRRTEVFGECVRMLLGRWDELKGIEDPFGLDPQQKRELIQPMALHLHATGESAAALVAPLSHRMNGIAAGFRTGKPGGELVVSEVLRHVEARSGLIESADSGYRFAHRAFQEYLTAQEIIDTGQEAILLQHAHEDAWREVARFYAGLLPDASDFLRRLLQRAGPLGPAALCIAGECAMDARRRAPGVAREVEAAVWRALRADLGQGRLPLELALTAGRVLGQGLAHRLLGCVGAEDAGTAPALLVEAALLAAPAAATPRVQQMLGDRDRPAAQRAEIATGVGRSGREELCPALLECAGDPDLQDAALEALEQIGPGAGEALASLLGRGDRPLQARAAAAIARVGDARAAGALLDALESATGEAAEALLRAAGELLAPIGDEGGLGGLVALSAPGGFYARFGKRAVDIAVAVVALPLMLTPMVIGALLVKASSRGPVFSRSRRVGRGGEEFTLLKLRTLRPEWEARARVGPVLAERDDPRVTVPGRWLRATSIDEFPQVLNILRGEMSWVGPRAHALWLAREFRAAVPLYDKRSLVRPGMTGLGQLYGLAASEGADQRVELREDLRYVRHLSLALDATIHLRSVAPALRSLLEP